MTSPKERFDELVNRAGSAGRYRRIVLQKLHEIIERDQGLAPCVASLSDAELESLADSMAVEHSALVRAGGRDPKLYEALASSLRAHCRSTGLDVAHRMTFTRRDLAFLIEVAVRHAGTKVDGERDADIDTLRSHIRKSRPPLGEALDGYLHAYGESLSFHEEVVRSSTEGAAGTLAALVTLHAKKEQARDLYRRALNTS